MSSIRGGKIPENPPRLAFITSSETSPGWQESHNFLHFYESCRAVAERLGIRLEVHWLGDETLTAERLEEILYTRGIRGGVLLPAGKFREKMNHDWSRIATVSYGIYEIVPGVDRIIADHYGNMEKALSILADRNFNRIAFAMVPAYPYENHNRWLAAYLAEYRGALQDRLTTPLLDPAPTFELFKAWFRETEPDLILCVNPSIIDQWLKQLGLEVPKDVSLVSVSSARQDGFYSGMAESPVDCGKLAMENLLDRIHQNQIGTPESPRCIRVGGQWIPGRSMQSA